jgi:small subunit ribosomal protein S6
MTRRYELALVASPQVPEEDHDKQLTSLEQLIADMGGVVHKVERWGRRKLAYPITKYTEGNYTLLLYDGATTVEKELCRRVKLSDTFIRFLSVRADEQKAPTEEEKAALEQARKDYVQRAKERAEQGLTGPDDEIAPLPGVAPLLAGVRDEAEDFVDDEEIVPEREDER